MAKKPSAGAGSADTDAVTDRIVDAASTLLQTTPWHRLSLADVAVQAGVPIGELYRRFPMRGALLAAVLRAIDLKALGQPIDTEGSARERLFESLMRRFDALTPFKSTMKNSASDLKQGELSVLPTALLSAIHSHCVLGWYIEAAGIPVEGLTGLARVKLVSVACLAAFQAWLGDEGEDSAKTMAALDKALGRIWSFMRVDRPAEASPEAEPQTAM
jgi:AcrR family transcriptional regulator